MKLSHSQKNKMFNVENRMENCAQCKEKLDEPRMLPCGETVCSKCLSSIQVNKNHFKCMICSEQHLMPEKGLPLNKSLLSFLSKQPNTIERGRSIEELTQKLKILSTNITSLSFTLNNSVEKIKEECNQLRNQVQLATELAIQQINVFNEEMINEINQFEIHQFQSCIQSYRSNEDNKIKSLKTVKELELFHSKWSQYLNTSQIKDQEISKACNDVTYLNDKAELEKLKIESSSGRILKFINNPNKLEKSLLGSLEFVKFNSIKSSILSDRQITKLMKICKFESNQKWDLIYRATQDGFGAKNFHSKSDNKSNTLVIIKSTGGHVFGGYTEQDWSPTGLFAKDSNAFIFSYINKYKKPFFMKCISPAHAICGVINYGPTFGGGHDIHICNNSNSTDGSYSNLGVSYEYPKDASNEDKSFLAGSYKFRTAEIEVYTKE